MMRSRVTVRLPCGKTLVYFEPAPESKAIRARQGFRELLDTARPRVVPLKRDPAFRPLRARVSEITAQKSGCE